MVDLEFIRNSMILNFKNTSITQELNFDAKKRCPSFIRETVFRMAEVLGNIINSETEMFLTEDLSGLLQGKMHYSYTF